MKSQPAPEIEVAVLSDIGRKRTTNQDAHRELLGARGDRLLILADGMGGHNGGEIASELACEAIQRAFDRGDADPPALLRHAFRVAHARIRQRADSQPELYGMGTTGVALWLDTQAHGWIAHVGDSRAYRLRDGQLELLTADHSVVAEMLRRGLLSPAQAQDHPRRNELFRSIGGGDELQIDLQQVDVRPADRYLLCSDGLSSVVDGSLIASVLASEPPSQAVRTLVELANSRGGPDNVTVQIAAVAPRRPTWRRSFDRRRMWAIAAAAIAALLGVVALLVGLSGAS
jgi:PPM family protein phosphatase